MDLNTLITDNDCGSNSHSSGRGRGRGLGRVGRRSQGSTLSEGSNRGWVISGGRSIGGGRSTTSGHGGGQGDMPPLTEGFSRHPKRKHEEVSRASESGSTTSGSIAKWPRRITPREERLSELALT